MQAARAEKAAAKYDSISAEYVAFKTFMVAVEEGHAVALDKILSVAKEKRLEKLTAIAPIVQDPPLAWCVAVLQCAVRDAVYDMKVKRTTESITEAVELMSVKPNASGIVT